MCAIARERVVQTLDAHAFRLPGVYYHATMTLQYGESPDEIYKVYVYVRESSRFGYRPA